MSKELTPKEHAREYIGKLIDQYADWIRENNMNMKFVEDMEYHLLFTENMMSEQFRKELTKLQNIVNDIEEA